MICRNIANFLHVVKILRNSQVWDVGGRWLKREIRSESNQEGIRMFTRGLRHWQRLERSKKLESIKKYQRHNSTQSQSGRFTKSRKPAVENRDRVGDGREVVLWEILRAMAELWPLPDDMEPLALRPGSHSEKLRVLKPPLQSSKAK